jgi:LuxR family maltose regulon positive regulatory protein
MHLIIITRADPPLPLTRLRARQQLAELRAADLRFTPAEAASFLQGMMALPLTADEVATIEARTEGWIAGLQFAALAMRDRPNRADFIHAFGGSNRFVVDYLADEVLNRLPAHLQTFVLQTAVLDRMCGALCDAVVLGDPLEPPLGAVGTQRAYSQALLEELERTNLFLVPLDDERHWYRYHHLFAEVLRQRMLSGAAPAMVARLHHRASVWFAQQNLFAQAISHALAAHDVEHAAQLVEQASSRLFARGEVATVRSWLAALPEELVRARPRLGLLECWVLTFAAQFEALEARLHDVINAIEASSELLPAQRRALASEVTVLRTRVAFSRNEAPRLSELRQALLDAPGDDLRLRSLLQLALGHAERLHGNALEASHAYAQANWLAQRTGDAFTAGSALVALAEHHEVRGQLHAAAEAHRQGLRLAVTRDGQPLPLAGFFHVGLGKQLREWNDLDAAIQHLQRGIGLGRQGGMQGIELDGAITLALVLQAQGDVAAAEGMLERAAEIAQTWGQPQIVLRVATFAARLALMHGRSPDAAGWGKAHPQGRDKEV